MQNQHLHVICFQQSIGVTAGEATNDFTTVGWQWYMGRDVITSNFTALIGILFQASSFFDASSKFSTKSTMQTDKLQRRT